MISDLEKGIYMKTSNLCKSVLRSVRVPVISNILYKVRVHENSSTKSDGKTLKHRDSFLIAIERALKNLYETGYRHHFTPYHVVKYFLHRCLLYSENRLPKRKNIRKNLYMILCKF